MLCVDICPPGFGVLAEHEAAKLCAGNDAGYRHLHSDFLGPNVRCCGDDNTCTSRDAQNQCFGEGVSFASAAAACASAGRRLCSLSELHLCCGSGCNYNLGYTWLAYQGAWCSS